MKYYADNLRNIGWQFLKLNSLIENDNGHLYMKSIIAYMIIGIGIYSCWKMTTFWWKNQSPNIGTVSFWNVLSLATFGIGGTLGLIINELSCRPKVYSRQNNLNLNVLLPVFTSYGLGIMSSEGWIPYSIDPSLSLLIGIAVGLIQMIVAAVSPINKEMYVQIGSDKAYMDFAKELATNSSSRIGLYKKKDLDKPIRQYGRNISPYKLSKEQISRYLLMSEEENGVVYQKYQRPDGKIISVAEIPNLTYKGVLDSIAGIMLAIILSTPYYSMMLTKMMKFLG